MSKENFLIVPKGVEVSPTGLTINAPLSFGEYEALAETVQRCHRNILWIAGDLLCWGADRFGESYAQVIEPRGYATQTLLNAAWVSSRVDRSRRRESLSWTHHSLVAALSPSDQDKFLSRAIDEGLSTRELRSAVRASGKVAVRDERVEIETQEGKEKKVMFELPQEYTVQYGSESESTPVHDAFVALMGAYGREHGLRQNLQFRVEVLEADGRVVRRYLGAHEYDHENGMLRVDTSVYLGTCPKEVRSQSKSE